MTPKQRQEFRELAMRCAREDKAAEMEALLAEAEQKQESGAFTKSDMTGMGMRMLAIIKLSKMAEFISAAKKLAAEADIKM